jgi:hypothetical protein
VWSAFGTSIGKRNEGEAWQTRISSRLIFPLLCAANENRWSDLLATLISTDPDQIARLLQIECDSVRREVVVPGFAGRRSDRLDLLLQSAGRSTAAIEVKLLSDLGPRQLERYRAAFPAVETYRVLHLATLPVNLRGVASWESLTWESVLSAYAASEHPWVSATARAWRTQLASLVPVVDENTVWNDVPDEPGAMELQLRARVTWLSRQMDFWCTLEHDMVPSSGGGNWVARMWALASAPGHRVTAELQEGMSAYEWRPDPKRPYRARFRGPVVLLGLRQDEVTTSADFDWKLLHRLYAEHVLDDHGAPQDDRLWQTTPPKPTDPIDRANWQSIVAAGAPKWLGKGWGMKVAKSGQACLFGGRFELMPNSTLGEIDAELQRLQPLIKRMAAH